VVQRSNIARRGGVFHFRRAVPKALRSRLRRQELVRTLATSNPQEARLRACELYLLSERLFAAARMPDTMLSEDHLTRLAQDFYAHILEQENRVRLTSGAITQEIRQKRQAYFEEIAKNARESLALNRLNNAIHHAVRRYRSNLKHAESPELGFKFVALESFILTLADAGATDYARALYRRYCDFLQVDGELSLHLTETIGTVASAVVKRIGSHSTDANAA
jgi:hypothetical protein